MITDGLGTVYKRAVFYFAKGDFQVEEFVEIPNRRTLGLIGDVEFRFCGGKWRDRRDTRNGAKRYPTSSANDASAARTASISTRCSRSVFAIPLF